MPSNRTPLNRARSPRIDSETIALFKELNAVPERRRESQEFQARDKELHERLGLGYERLCSQVSTLDPRPTTHYRQNYQPHQYGNWLRMRELRLRLLTLAGISEPPPEKAKPARSRARKLA
jgi:hypothetical protein